MPDTLTGDVAELLAAAGAAATDPRSAAALAAARRRLDEPLRVAIAGRVKAGKSTLLNALLGEELAATDAGECTRVVTWYRAAPRPQATVHPRSGPALPRPFDRAGIDLAGLDPDGIDHIDIGWPSRHLAHLTFIDTPGIASLSTDVSARTHRALTPDDDAPAQADAVIYLLRHAHASDVRFLEAFHADELARGTSLNAIGVLARADEIGASRSDALAVAARIAGRYQRDPRLGKLCPLVVPVSGLMAVAGETLRRDEYGALAELAAAPVGEVTALLLTAERFAARPSSVAVSELDREHLLGRLGLFGVRSAVELIRRGAVRNPPALRAELVRRSGLPRLRAVLLAQFTRRARVLRARSALAALGGVLAAGGVHDPRSWQVRAEEITASAHEFVEIRLLTRLHSGALPLADDRATELERLLGARGQDAASRLGAPAAASSAELGARADEEIDRWRRRAAHPLASRPEREAYGVVVRSLEGVRADLDAQ